MSNAIDLIVQDKAVKGLDGLIVKLQKAHEEIQKINSKGIKFTSESNTGGLQQTVTLTEEYNKLLKATERANIQAELAQTKTNKALLEARERKNAINKQTRLQIKYEQALEGVYSKMDAKLSILNREYRDLAARKELGVKLTKEEEKRMDFLISKITKYDSVLKKVDAQSGKNQRNVGNYKSAFDGLSFSISQLTREAPAFANSMQTGFMAISNNLPIFFDEIAKTKREVASLRAEGKATSSVMSRLATSFFSLQTLLSVGVTLLTIYGKDIVEWASNMIKGDQAVEKLAESTKELNKQSSEIASQTIPQFQALVKIATDVSESEERRADAIKELNKSYPDFNANILNEKNNTDAVNKAVEEYINKIGQKAKAQASMNMMQEKYNALILAEQEAEQKTQNLLEAVNSIRQLNNKELFETREEALKYVNDIREATSGSTMPSSMRGGTSPLIGMLEGIEDKSKEVAETQEEINALMQVYMDNVDLSTTSVNKNTQSTKTNNRELEKGAENKLNSVELTKLETKAYELLNDELYKNKVLEAEAGLEQQNRLKELRKQTDDYLQSTATGSLGGLGFGSLTQFFDGSFDKLLEGADTVGEKFAVTFNAIGEVAKETFAFINNLSQQHFDQQYDRLSQQEAISLQFVEGNAAAEEEIRRQSEEKRKQIQKKEAKANKANAMFNIGINTAQGVVSALGMFPPNPVLAGIIAGIGAAQLAVVASQQIPQFKDGVRGFEGGLAVVGDGGVQEVIETKNGISLTPNTDTLVNLPKGANVYKNKEEFFNEKLNSILINNGISPITSVREQKAINEERLASLIGKEIKRMPKGNAIVNFDEKGMNTYWDNGVTKKKMLNARVRGLGRNT